jgi:hypothetical protein
MKKTLFLILVCSFLASSQTKVGSTAAPFLNIGIGPRAISMGGAFVATSNDVTSLYWNPAGVAQSRTNEALFSYTRWFADISYNWAGAMVNLGDFGAVGLSLTYLDYGEMEVTTMSEQEGTGEMFTASDLAFAATYAYNLTDRFSMGMTAKYINQRIWNSSASAFAVDLGILFISDIYGMRIGATITNFGTDMKIDGKDLFVLHDIDPTVNGNNDQILARFNTDEYPLPLTFRVGVAKDFDFGESNRITLGVDATHPNDNSESVNIGAEYSYNNTIFFRGGYKALFLENSEEGLALGIGVKHRFSNQFGILIEYAYQDFGVLDFTQHVAVGVTF